MSVPSEGDRKALSEILAAFSTNGERNALAVLAEYRETFSSRIAELEKELTTPILVTVNRLADSLADARARIERLKAREDIEDVARDMRWNLSMTTNHTIDSLVAAIKEDGK